MLPRTLPCSHSPPETGQASEMTKAASKWNRLGISGVTSSLFRILDTSLISSRSSGSTTHDILGGKVTILK